MKFQIQNKISFLKKKVQRSSLIKPFYNSVIPLHIFQTWHTKNLPPNMRQSVEYIKRSNPRFHHRLFDDNECHDFIRDNFDESVLHAYNKLIPGAYKADLWRYCVLYKLGGIYLDIKYIPTKEDNVKIMVLRLELDPLNIVNQDVNDKGITETSLPFLA